MFDAFDLDNLENNFEDITPDNIFGSNFPININGIDEAPTLGMPSLGGETSSNGDFSDGQTFGLPNHHGQFDSGSHLDFQPDNNGQDDMYIDLSQLSDGVNFEGHSQSEINSHISEAKHDIAREESLIRHNTNIVNSKARMGEPHSLEDYQIREAQNRLNQAKKELYKWQHTKPS